MGFVGEEVKVLIEKRKVSRVHVRYKTLNLVMLCSCFADCMTFSNVTQFFLCFWYCARAPAPTPGVDVMTCLGGWFKKPSGDCTHSPTLYAQGFKGTKLQYYKKVVGPLLTSILPICSSEVYWKGSVKIQCPP